MATNQSPPHDAAADALHRNLDGDPRRESVRAYEDAFLAFSGVYYRKFLDLRDENPTDIVARARALWAEDDAWTAAHPEPYGLLPPALPGGPLHPSGLQPTGGMFEAALIQATFRARLEALIAGGPRSVLHGVLTEPKSIEEYHDAAWHRYRSRYGIYYDEKGVWQPSTTIHE